MTKTHRKMINDLQQAISMLEASEAFERALEIAHVSKDEEDRKRFEVANYRVTDTALDIVASVHEELLRQTKSDPEYTFKESIAVTRESVEKVLDSMRDLIKRHGRVSVSDYYDLVGLTGSRIDERRGWFDLDKSHVQPIGEGYVMKLPRPVNFYN